MICNTVRNTLYYMYFTSDQLKFNSLIHQNTHRDSQSGSHLPSASISILATKASSIQKTQTVEKHQQAKMTSVTPPEASKGHPQLINSSI